MQLIKSGHSRPFPPPPAAARQLPLLQLCPDAHALPQPPQFRTSVDVSTQPLPQSVWPPVHAVVTQPPFWHVWSTSQGLPQAPQFFTSVLRSLQVAPHAVFPPVQVGAP